MERCPNWEQRKYVAFGATVLVPTVFAIIACGYALSTLTDNWNIIIPVALAWGFIIMTIDRALLATYRSFQSWSRKIGQFSLRFVVAMLMGLTISHPLTLLLFKDTISSVVEGHREDEIREVREVAAEQKLAVEGKITGVEVAIQKLRDDHKATYAAEFLVASPDTGLPTKTTDEAAAEQTELEKQLAAATAGYREQIVTIEAEMAESDVAYKKVQGELEFWQKEFERELNGQRSGIVGLGPRAKSIQSDHLQWRRAESQRLTSVMESLTAQRNEVRALVQATEGNVVAEFENLSAEEAARMKAEHDRIAALTRQVQQEQADQFVGQQNAVREGLNLQIGTRQGELGRLQTEVAGLAEDEQTRVAAIRAEPRRDILTQTLALHELFLNGADGGTFALSAYLVLTMLFMLVDTIPLMVKFFSNSGPYDTLVDCEEVRYEKEREAFLGSYHEHMEKLSPSRKLHLTQEQPLEQALVDGVERSRAAKDFLESLMEMEHAFEERIAVERAMLAEEADESKVAARAKMLEEMAETFYDDMRERMATFFGGGEVVKS